MSRQPLQEKHEKKILGMASHEKRPFLELTRNISEVFEEIKSRVIKKLT